MSVNLGIPETRIQKYQTNNMWVMLLKSMTESRMTKCILTPERPTHSYGDTIHNHYEQNEIFLERCTLEDPVVWHNYMTWFFKDLVTCRSLVNTSAVRTSTSFDVKKQL
jgi:hypothetical protein